MKDIDIRIRGGKVEAEVNGASGPTCLQETAEFLARVSAEHSIDKKPEFTALTSKQEAKGKVKR